MDRRTFFIAALSAAVFLTTQMALAAEKKQAERNSRKAEAKPAAKAGRWESIFEGESTEKLRGYKRADFPAKGWKVENGVLKAIAKGEVVDLVTKETYENFELELDWKVTAGANSGVMFHVSEEFAEPWNTGPEVQVLDDALHKDGKNPTTSAGALYALVAPTNKVLRPVGEWNRFRLVVNGKRVRHFLNGTKVLDVKMDSPEVKALIRKSKFAEHPKFNTLSSGHIVIQHHTDEVWYKDIRVRRLPNKPKKNDP